MKILVLAELHGTPRRSPIAKEMWYRPSVRTTGITMQNDSINRYGNPNATQRFNWNEITWPPRLLERKNNNKVLSFSALFLMFTLTWTTEKELERVIENKGDEFRREKNMEIQSGSEKMRNASGQQGENERQ